MAVKQREQFYEPVRFLVALAHCGMSCLGAGRGADAILGRLMEIRIDVRDDYKRVIKSLGALADKQIPFAISQALNEIGAAVVVAEKREIKNEFSTATPFTVNSVRQKKARKGELETTVFVADIAQAYLLPYLDGGRHHLNSRALLNPKNIALNAYGNLPRNQIAQLKGRANVFIGAVKTKKGQTVNGIWLRVAAVTARKATKRYKERAASGAHLKLLVRFGDALPVKQRLKWGGTAQGIVDRMFDKTFGKWMAKAIATAGLK